MSSYFQILTTWENKAPDSMSTISLPSLDSLAPTYESNESSTFSLSTTSSRSSSISGEEGDRPQVAQQMQSQSTALSHNHQEAVLSCFSGIDARRRHQATEEELARLDDLFPKGVEVDINDQESNLRQEGMYRVV